MNLYPKHETKITIKTSMLLSKEKMDPTIILQPYVRDRSRRFGLSGTVGTLGKRFCGQLLQPKDSEREYVLIFMNTARSPAMETPLLPSHLYPRQHRDPPLPLLPQ